MASLAANDVATSASPEYGRRQAFRTAEASGFAIRRPLGSGFGPTGCWTCTASNGAGGWARGGRELRWRPLGRRPELGQRRRWRYRARQGEPVGASGSQERGEHAGDARASGRAQEHGARWQWRRRASVLVGNGATATKRGQG